MAFGVEECPAIKPLPDTKGWLFWEGTWMAQFLLVLLVGWKRKCAITSRSPSVLASDCGWDQHLLVYLLVNLCEEETKGPFRFPWAWAFSAWHRTVTAVDPVTCASVILLCYCTILGKV